MTPNKSRKFPFYRNVIFISLAVLLAALGVWRFYDKGGSPALEYTDVQPQTALSMLKEFDDLVILDVREQYEYAETRIPGSRLIPLQQLYSGGYQDLEKDDRTLVVCHTGRRSAQASKFLVRQGFTSVYNLAGGILEWSGPTEGKLE